MSRGLLSLLTQDQRSALDEGDVDAANFALRVDRDGLLVAVRAHRQIGGEAGRLDENIDPTVAGAALQVAVDVAASQSNPQNLTVFE